MAKLQPIKTYINKLTKRCTLKFGDEFVADNEELIELAARNKRQLDRFDAELDDADLTVTMIGSTGQQKEDINPIIKHRNDIAKLYADNLEALMLTPRAKFKKADKPRDPNDENDPTMEYFNSING